MWSLFPHPQHQSSASDHSSQGVDTDLQALFAQLLDQISDQTAKTAFTKRFAQQQTVTTTDQPTYLAALFESLITYLLDHQPPATKSVLTRGEIHSIITKQLDPSQVAPALMGALAMGPLQLAGILGIGIERLAQLYYAELDSVAARESLDYMVGHLPYQVPADLYSQLTAGTVPSLRPLLKPLSDLGHEDLVSNIRFIYHYYIDVLVKNNQKLPAVKAMQEVYAFISQTYPQELTLTFLDLVPAGWLEQERGNLLGRQELLKVLDQLQHEKSKLEAVNVRDEALLSSIGDGVVAVDEEGRVIFINDSALQLLGFQNQDLTSINWFKDVPLVDKNDQSIPKDQRPMIQAIRTKKPCVTNDLSFVRHDQTKLPAAITATPYVTQGQVVGAILVFKDMTREREIDRQKTEFISVASHQLRTPLGSMKLNLEMLAKKYHGELPVAATQAVKQTLEVAERTVQLVNNLLNISRIETGRIQDHPTQVKVAEVLQATITELQPILEDKKITLTLEVAEKLPVLTIDEARIREVLENIISNAIKYSFEAGAVTIKISATSDTMMFEVADQGIGIPEKDQFKLFSRFFRAENAMNQEPNGSGFGLFVVKSYIESWGGKIWFKSPTTSNHQGTTFFIQIPLQVKSPSDGLYMDHCETASESSSTAAKESTL